MKVCELSGSDIVAMQDVLDTTGTPLVGVRCDGRFQGGYCRIFYYFSLGDRPARTTGLAVTGTPTPTVTITTISATLQPVAIPK